MDMLDQMCISFAKFSFLVNDTFSSFFQSFGGLRQGDPLSPYLFALSMETLSCLLKWAKDGSYLLRFRVKGKGVEREKVSYLLFVDNTFVFLEASQDQIVHLSLLLMWFENYLEKSELISIERVDNI